MSLSADMAVEFVQAGDIRRRGSLPLNTSGGHTGEEPVYAGHGT